MVDKETKEMVEKIAAQLKAAGKSYVLFVGTRTQYPIFAAGGDTTMIGWLLGYGTKAAKQKVDGDKAQQTAFLDGWARGMVQAVKE
ncbi:MAG: hypothetical protein II857_05720 [Selenomonadaceae bacterium]|nr:hypothetical protein [Selenomonadaceae bacterium]